MDTAQLYALDLAHVWHPCSQMKDYEQFKPLPIHAAFGSHLELTDGRKIIDAISSWWCKSLWHQHPRLKKALLAQLERFEHVIFANTTYETIVQLSQQLASFIPELNKVFYASDGSCAVEIAMKMSVHARVLTGNRKKMHFMALKNGYHGETLGALSVSDLGIYRQPYRDLLLQPHFIAEIPYVSGTTDPLWDDCSSLWNKMEASLEPHAHSTTALILEPILQGAGGMKIYSQDFLKRLAQWAKAHDIHLIADEIMTGLGRTGTLLACEHATIVPDFICLSKGLTSGWLPLSAMLTTESIYQLFYDEYSTGKAFLHSHTHSGNALAAAVALETVKVIQEEQLCARAQQLSTVLLKNMKAVAENTGRLTTIRSIGAMVAADLITDSDSRGRRLGFEIYQAAVQRGALLRPLGNTLYWLPPLTVDLQTLTDLKNITQAAIEAVFSS